MNSRIFPFQTVSCVTATTEDEGDKSLHVCGIQARGEITTLYANN